MESERRRVPRYPFIATAELIEVQSEAKFAVRTSELSLYGCYLDMMNVLPEGTQVKLKVTHQNAILEALGRVIYSHPNMGMAVVFDSVEPAQQAVLEKWLRELSGA